MDWLETKYINLLSVKLDKFKRKGSTLYNFRCPLCGDSSDNKNKARAYFYGKKDKMYFHCHNCNAPIGSFTNFLKKFDQNLYDEFQYEKIKENKTAEQIEYEDFVNKMKKPVFLQSGPLKGLKKISQLDIHDPVKCYVAQRKIPNPYHAKLFSCPNFKSFTNQLIPNKFDEASLLRDETRLLIPFFNRDKKLHAYQVRSLNDANKIKYITIVLNEDIPKVYGLDTVDFNKTVYVFEGPIDSMFIPNSIATAGGDMVGTLKNIPKDNLVIVYDNEPRSKDTINKIEKAILNGYKVCVWPENIEHKDVNDMIKKGLSSEFIKYIIDNNTYKDLNAQLTLIKWSKV
jgi:hypothetical protein